MRVRAKEISNVIRLHRNECIYREWSKYPDLNYYYNQFKSILGYDDLFFIEGVSGGIKNIFEVLKPNKISYDTDFRLFPVYETLYKGNGPSIQFISDPETKIDSSFDHIVIDDVYQHFHKYNWDTLLPNVTILRSFSKAYGLAGLRIGYMIGELSEKISLYRGGYEANTFSLNEALKALQYPKTMLEYVCSIEKSKDYLLNYNIYTYNGFTNYVHCKYNFSKELLEHGYAVKSLDNGMRITLAPLHIIKPLNDLILKWI